MSNYTDKFIKAVRKTLRHEGGFVNDRVDPGGATNWGISIRYLLSRGDLVGDIDGDGDIDVDDIREMSVNEAMDIYYIGFWEPYDYETIIHDEVAAKVFDMTVNMGAKQAGKIVQRALNTLGEDLDVDGAIGAQTMAAINDINGGVLITAIREQQARFYESLIANKPALAKYRKGWLRRANA